MHSRIALYLYPVNEKNMNRREFLNKAGLGVGAFILPSTELIFPLSFVGELKRSFSIGIVTDAHHGMLPDTEQRLEKFINEAVIRNVDFIIQMGDFLPAEINITSFQPPQNAQVKLLGAEKILNWEYAGSGFKVTIPKKLRKSPPCKYAWTILVSEAK